MTKAFAQERAQQPPLSRDRQAHPSDASSAIPVLIRLPELEPPTVTEQAGSQSESVQPEVTPPDVARVAEKSDLEPAAAGSATEPAVAESSTTAHSQEKDGSWWSDFRMPSSAIHAAVALALIAVFIVAYMAIVGGGNDAEEIAADPPAAQQKQPADRGKGDSQAGTPLAFNTFVPEDSQKPATGGASQTRQPAASKPAGAAANQPAAKQPAAKPKQPPAKKAAVPAEKQPAGGPKQPTAEEPTAPKSASAIASEEQAPSIQQTEFESPAGSPTGQSAAQPPSNRDSTDRPVGFRNETPARQDLAANNPRLDAPPESETAGNPSANSPPVYPMTNPASYQYPADYHERLLSPAGVQSSPRSSPWSDGNAGDDQRPSTARLQPRIEAPPVR